MGEIYASLKVTLGGIPPIDALLQLLMVATIVWLAIRDPAAKLQERLDRHGNYIRDLQEGLRKLEAQVRKSTTPIGNEPRKTQVNFQPYPDTFRPTPSPVSIEPPRPPQTFYEVNLRPQTRRLYAKSPEADGTFKAGNLQVDPVYDSLYVLLLSAESNTARVQLYGDADGHQTAIQSPSIYLDPVCTYDRQPTPYASRISTVREGEAVLEGERWRMKRKLEIDFS